MPWLDRKLAASSTIPQTEPRKAGAPISHNRRTIRPLYSRRKAASTTKAESFTSISQADITDNLYYNDVMQFELNVLRDNLS
ncbi:hypothetical protein EVAR_31395_1 [Eumeta japonica]|uniref:Uncharacterized protein n=1 Tax=Eumeta variegata TaxID=151549 RepID=A0A4C1UZ82_EUMVA|nr:hypothetical protein EVAR_31395_1 [Eumeta japonica]